ncbi:hypothetical protein Tco_0247316 [Tanacetum coccineum]
MAAVEVPQTLEYRGGQLNVAPLLEVLRRLGSIFTSLYAAAHLLRENTDSFLVFATGVPVGPMFLLGLLVPAIVTAYASRAATTLSVTSFLMAA